MLRLVERPGAVRVWLSVALVLAALVLGTGVAPAGAAVGARPAVVSSAQTDGSTTTVAPAPGDGAATTEEEGTAADDPAQDRLRLVIVALLVLAAVVLLVTVLFWRVTSPKRVVTVSELGPDDLDDDVHDELEPIDLSGPAPTPDRAFAAALMAPSSPLPVVREPVPEAVVEAPPAPEAAADPEPEAGPGVVRPDPVEWPEPEPDRLDLRQPPVVPDVEQVIEVDEVPDPPRFESTAEQPAIELPEPAPAAGDWTEWQGIRPLGPVDRSAERDG